MCAWERSKIQWLQTFARNRPPPPATRHPPRCVCGTLPHWHIGTLPHWHIATLAHCHIGTLAHCHISTFSHVHRSKMTEITKMPRTRSPWLRLTREWARSTRTGLIKPMGCLPAPKKIGKKSGPRPPPFYWNRGPPRARCGVAEGSLHWLNLPYMPTKLY